MRIPLVVHVAVGLFALPVIVAWLRRRALDRPTRLIAWWFFVLVAQNVLGRIWVHWVDPTNNLIIAQLVIPIEAALVLLALSEWQVQPVARTAARLAIPIYWVAWGSAMALLEKLGTFSTFAAPVLALLVLSFAFLAFVSRLGNDDDPALHSAWGYILPALAIFFANNASATIVMQVGMSRNDIPMLVNTTLIRSWIHIITTLVISWGLFWPTRPRSSGASFSPPPSR